MPSQAEVDADLEKFLAEGDPPSSGESLSGISEESQGSSGSRKDVTANWRKSAERISRIQESVGRQKRVTPVTDQIGEEQGQGSLVADILDVIHGGSSGSSGGESADATPEASMERDRASLEPDTPGTVFSNARSSSFGRVRRGMAKRSADVIGSASAAFHEIVRSFVSLFVF